MSKSSKASVKRTVGKAKLTRKPRAVRLAIEEPRISVRRNSRKMTRKPRTPQARKIVAPVAGEGSAAAEIFQLMLNWSPWNVMLRQQAILASLMSTIMRAKK